MKKTKRKRNKIDPLIKLAEKNKLESMSAHNANKIDNVEKKEKLWTKKEKEHNSFVRDMEAHKLFQEMKKRDF